MIWIIMFFSSTYYYKWLIISIHFMKNPYPWLFSEICLQINEGTKETVGQIWLVSQSVMCCMIVHTPLYTELEGFMSAQAELWLQLIGWLQGCEAVWLVPARWVWTVLLLMCEYFWLVAAALMWFLLTLRSGNEPWSELIFSPMFKDILIAFTSVLLNGASDKKIMPIGLLPNLHRIWILEFFWTSLKMRLIDLDLQLTVTDIILQIWAWPHNYSSRVWARISILSQNVYLGLSIAKSVNWPSRSFMSNVYIIIFQDRVYR